MRPTWAEIHLDHLAHNFRTLKKQIGASCKYLAVVKANAYGHGAIGCAQKLEREGIDWFGVAIPDEAIQLRESGITKPILCLGGFWNDEEEAVIRFNITPAIFRMDSAERLNRAAKNAGVEVSIHLKIDTGMGRVGIPFQEFREFVDRICELKNLRIDGLMTHFASADNPKEDEFTEKQIALFDQACDLVAQKGIRVSYRDLANSPAAIRHPKSRQSMVRLGGLLYGLARDVLPSESMPPNLLPVMTLHTKISLIKEVQANQTLGYGRTYKTSRPSRIATIPIGYYDGYPRALSNKGRAIVCGAYANVVARVSMDWTLIDVTDIPSAALESEVIVIGGKNGLSVTAEEIAGIADTISYELTCGLGERVERRIVS